ncbi:MAG: hypothetical protein ACRD9L_26875 [Bryobacteraceae bacterium]
MFRSNRARIAFVCLWAAALLVAIDALTFRTGLYRSIVEPEPYAGQTEMLLKSEAADKAPAQVLVQLADRRGVLRASGKSKRRGWPTFVNAAISASTLRGWHYRLRDLDPANKYRAVVLAVDGYNDEDGAWDWADRLLDLHILIFRLRLADVWDFARPFHGAGARFDAFLGSVLNGAVLKEDVQELLARPAVRFGKVEVFDRSGADWRYG